jgi:glutaredoxin
MIVRTEGDGHVPATDQTLLFGADWCGDCRRTKSWLRRHDVPFIEHDTAEDESARTQAVALAGSNKIPVLVTPDGTVLVEPTSMELAATLTEHRSSTARSRCR